MSALATEEHPAPVGLDLGSAERSISGEMLGSSAVIRVGDSERSVGAGDLLTAAEYAAALQVISGSAQSLNLSQTGVATGGNLVLGANLANTLHSLTVPSGVTIIHDFGLDPSLSLTGNLVNNGSVLAISTSANITGGSISALNIINNPGALISSVLPAGGLSGYTNLVSQLDLTLNAVQSVLNHGAIASSGSLTINAAEIVNSASATVNSATAAITAVNNVNLVAAAVSNQGIISANLANVLVQTNQLTNSGILRSVSGSVEIQNLFDRTLAIANIGGTISAQNTLSIIDSSNSNNALIELSGGQLQADEIKFSARSGTVEIELHNVSPDLHFDVQGVDLTVLGGTNGLRLTGLDCAEWAELTYLGLGDVTSSGFRTGGRSIEVVTTGSITFNGNLDTTSVDRGGNVSLVSAGSIQAKDIITSGKESENGGHITLLSHNSVTAGHLDSAGGETGWAGIISVVAGVLGEGAVNLSSANAGTRGIITLASPTSVTVSGTVSAPKGLIVVKAPVSNIGRIDRGDGGGTTGGTTGGDTTGGEPQILMLDLSDFDKVGTGNVVVGGELGLDVDIVLTGKCNGCFDNLSGIIFNTSGSFSSEGVQLTLPDDFSLKINAGEGITTGAIAGGNDLVLNTSAWISLNGPVSMTGDVLLTASGVTILEELSAASVVINPVGDMTLEAAHLENISTPSLQIVGASGNLVLTGHADLSNITSQLVIDIGTGAVSLEAASLLLSPSVMMTISGGQVTTGALWGASSLEILAQNALTVAGEITAAQIVLSTPELLTISASVQSSGLLQLHVGDLEIDAPVAAELLKLDPLNDLVISAGQLQQLVADTLQIGAAGEASLTLIGSGDLSGIGQLVIDHESGIVDLGRSYLTFSETALVTVRGSNVSLGAIQGGAEVVVTAEEVVLVAGSIDTPGPLTLQGNDLELSAVNIEASSVHVLSEGSIQSGAVIAARDGGIFMSAGTALTLLDGARMTAARDIKLEAVSGATLGAIEGVSLAAGAAAQPTSGRPVSYDDIISGGSISIDTWLGGRGAGDISIGSSTLLNAYGAGGDGGDIGLLSGADITIDSNARLVAMGGDLWLSAADDVSIGAATLTSIAAIDGPVSGGTYNSLPTHTGARVAILAGTPGFDAREALDDLPRRVNVEQSRVTGGAFDPSNRLTMGGGSIFEVIFPEHTDKTITNNEFELSGGIILLDPPDPGNDVNIAGASISAIGPALTPPPPVVAPPPVIDLPPDVGTGAGASVPVLVAPGISGAVGGSVTSNDTTSSSQPSSVRLQSNQVTVGQSVVPSDTIEEEFTGGRGVRPAVFCTSPLVLKPKERIDEDSWIIASNSCQPFTFEAQDGSLIVGTGPAKFAPAADRTLLLKEGKLLVITVDKVHVVRTPMCNVTIPLNTATIIEVQAEGLTRITNLSGGKNSVTVCRNEETFILSAAPGEQLSLSESSLPEENFMGFVYHDVTHRRVDKWNMEISGLRGQKLSFNRAAMANREPLLHCIVGCVNKVQLRRLELLLQSMQTDETLLKSMIPSQRTRLSASKRKVSSMPANAKLHPVSYRAGEASASADPTAIGSLNAGAAVVKYVQHPGLSLEGYGVISLENGEVLVHARKKTLVKSRGVMVWLNPGTLALVSRKSGMLKVRNVYEKGSAAIKVSTAAGKCIGLQVGHEVIIGPRGVSLSAALSDEPVGRRKLKNVESPDHSFICSEFSMSSLIQNSAVLSQLMKSQDDEDRELRARIMKMAVCLSVVTSSHGSYSMSAP